MKLVTLNNFAKRLYASAKTVNIPQIYDMGYRDYLLSETSMI